MNEPLNNSVKRTLDIVHLVFFKINTLHGVIEIFILHGVIEILFQEHFFFSNIVEDTLFSRVVYGRGEV